MSKAPKEITVMALIKIFIYYVKLALTNLQNCTKLYKIFFV